MKLKIFAGICTNNFLVYNDIIRWRRCYSKLESGYKPILWIINLICHAFVKGLCSSCTLVCDKSCIVYGPILLYSNSSTHNTRTSVPLTRNTNQLHSYSSFDVDTSYISNCLYLFFFFFTEYIIDHTSLMPPDTLSFYIKKLDKLHWSLFFFWVNYTIDF